MSVKTAREFLLYIHIHASLGWLSVEMLTYKQPPPSPALQNKVCAGEEIGEGCTVLH